MAIRSFCIYWPHVGYFLFSRFWYNGKKKGCVCMWIVSFLLLAASAVIVFFFSHMNGSFKESFPVYISSDEYAETRNDDPTIIFSLFLPIASGALLSFVPSLPFLVYIPLLVFAIVIRKNYADETAVIHRNAESDYKVYVYFFFLFILSIVFDNSKTTSSLFLVLCPFLLLYSGCVIARANLLRNLFFHYRARTIKLESQVEKLKEDLSYYQAKLRRYEHD